MHNNENNIKRPSDIPLINYEIIHNFLPPQGIKILQNSNFISEMEILGSSVRLIEVWLG